MFAMQLYAFDHSGEVIFSRHAQKKCNYTCMECSGTLRLREGEKRQLHFYHLKPSPSCRQSAKSAAHLQTQLYLQRTLPEGEVFLEYRFSDVNRIADVVWLPQKLVFEVQCSPLSKEEMEERMADYAKCGFQVIWIFHDKRYNQWRVSAVERGLAKRYFTNIDGEGRGCIYDQWEYIERGVRKGKLRPLQVDVARPYPDGFEGDLGSLEEGHPYLEKVREREVELQMRGGFELGDLFQKVGEWGKQLMVYLLKPYCS